MHAKNHPQAFFPLKTLNQSKTLKCPSKCESTFFESFTLTFFSHVFLCISLNKGLSKFLVGCAIVPICCKTARWFYFSYGHINETHITCCVVNYLRCTLPQQTYTLTKFCFLYSLFFQQLPRKWHPPTHNVAASSSPLSLMLNLNLIPQNRFQTLNTAHTQNTHKVMVKINCYISIINPKVFIKSERVYKCFKKFWLCKVEIYQILKSCSGCFTSRLYDFSASIPHSWRCRPQPRAKLHAQDHLLPHDLNPEESQYNLASGGEIHILSTSVNTSQLIQRTSLHVKYWTINPTRWKYHCASLFYPQTHLLAINYLIRSFCSKKSEGVGIFLVCRWFQW